MRFFASSKHPNRVPALLVTLVGALLALYFGSHALNGSRGVLALTQLDQDIDEATAVLSQRQHERAVLEARVRGLSAPRIDRDLLDERARLMLNRLHPDEFIVVFERASPP